MIDDVVLNKSESIERCVKQVKKYYAMPSDITFDEDFLRQDAIALNLQRACEQAIDLANHVIKVYKFGLPKESRDSFDILARNGAISSELAGRLQSMVGFKNTLVIRSGFFGQSSLYIEAVWRQWGGEAFADYLFPRA